MDILVHINFDRLRIWSLASVSGGWGSLLCYARLGTQCQEKSSTQMLEKHQRPKGCLFTFPYDSYGPWHAGLWWSPSWVQNNVSAQQSYIADSGRQAAGRWGGTASAESGHVPLPPFYHLRQKKVRLMFAVINVLWVTWESCAPV